MGRIAYFVGDYVDHRFTPLFDSTVAYGCLYAPLTCEDDQHRRLMWGWLREGRSTEDQIAAGWASVQSFSRILRLNGHQLQMEPVPELKQIRGKQHHFATVNLATESIELADANLYLDIELEFSGDSMDIALARSTDGRQQTYVIYEHEQQTLTIKRATSSILPSVESYTEPRRTRSTLTRHLRCAYCWMAQSWKSSPTDAPA